MYRPLLILLALILSACEIKFRDLSNADAGIEAAQPLILKIRLYMSHHGVYPEDIQTMDLSNDLRKSIKRYEYSYHVGDNGQSYTLGFEPRGLIFLCAYGEGHSNNIFNSKGWSCTSK